MKMPITIYLVALVLNVFIFLFVYISLSFAYEVELPKVPERPSIKELKESLAQKNTKDKSLKQSDYQAEKKFDVNLTQLFALSLSAIQSLNLNLNSFDVTKGEIVAMDMLRNTFVLNITQNGKNESKMAISGYGSLLGKKLVDNTANKLLAKINGKENKQ